VVNPTDLRQSKKVRADALLLEAGLADSRSKAQALILAGDVFAGEERVEKPGSLLRRGTELRVRAGARYVSRGGLKLEGALADFGFDPQGLVCADIGASTGGFTDCLLQAGAARVYAVDVGHGQLASKLRTDERVVVLERTNARSLTAETVGGGVDLSVVDASFIGLEKLLPALFAILRPGGFLLALIKPQFEVGREEAKKARGVIRDEELRASTVREVLDQVERAGLVVHKDAPCRVPGPKGNVEHFVLAERPSGDASARAPASSDAPVARQRNEP
jgi:23S rRNA (cytidine1920-2'-O)/16S rRNA (cytidine1409-2'-O)-methyltransferase